MALPRHSGESRNPAPARALDDRLGEALRRAEHGLIRPLWADAPEELRERWRARARALRHALKTMDLRVAAVDTASPGQAASRNENGDCNG